MTAGGRNSSNSSFHKVWKLQHEGPGIIWIPEWTRQAGYQAASQMLTRVETMEMSSTDDWAAQRQFKQTWRLANMEVNM